MPDKKKSPGLFQGIMLSYLILLLHVLLIAGIGVLIIFIKGFIAYFPLIVLAGLSVLGGSAYYLFRRLKAEEKSLRSVLSSPLFSGKSVEISLFGGAASIKIAGRNSDNAVPAIETGDRNLLKDHASTGMQAFTAQAKQLENDYYDPTAHQKLKRNLHS